MAGRSKWYEVHCELHGRPDAGDNLNIKRVTVGIPRNKREKREGGCPFCKGEKAAAVKS